MMKQPDFDQSYLTLGEGPLRAAGIDIFQINVGKLCNQKCKHCHVEAGPERREIMTRETFELSLAALKNSQIGVVDITGGAPEMNPHFKWFVTEVRKLNRHVIVHSNLTILVARGYEDYAEFMADQKVEIVSSLPHYTASNTDRQRGDGTFEKSILAIRQLNRLGYGIEGGLPFNLVYNPVGAFLPGSQSSLGGDYKRELSKKFGISFNHLYTITNMPVGRFLEYLISSGNYEAYMTKLVEQFNPQAAQGVMCKNTISIGWDGFLYDCDFNQMMEMKISNGTNGHIREFSTTLLSQRVIQTGSHCYDCTAGSGSSCGGTTT